MTPKDALLPIVEQFVSTVDEALKEAAPRDDYSDEDRRSDVVGEAFNLCCAFVESDMRVTDNELWAIGGAFGELRSDPSLSGSTPQMLREANLTGPKAGWLLEPSTMFDILATSDKRDGTQRAQAYYKTAMKLVHLMAAVDSATTRSELEAISDYRDMLLNHIKEHGNVSNPAPPAPKGRAGTTEADEASAPISPPKRPLEEVLAELDALVGLVTVKKEVRLLGDLLSVQRMREEAGLKKIDTSLHMVFTGNPGTGKTTVARLLAAIYHSLGALEVGQLVETDRSGLVAGFVGQTAPLVQKRFEEAEGGMLFIDEAYTLTRGGEADFGKEAIDTMVKLMEDQRDSTALVVAGYPNEMNEFVGANPGLASRFPTTIHFPDYSTDELIAIFELIANSKQYKLSDDGKEMLRQRLDAVERGKGFGNGRQSRNMFEEAVRRHASRVVGMDKPDSDTLSTLTAEDLRDAAGELQG